MSADRPTICAAAVLPRDVASALPGSATPGNVALVFPRDVASALPGSATPGNVALGRSSRAR